MIDVNEKVSYKEFFKNQREIISWLEDDLSKRIFALKCGTIAGLSPYSLTPYAKNCVILKCKEQKIIDDILSDTAGDPIIIYGLNLFSEVLYRNIFQKLRNKRVLICDRNAEQLEKMHEFPIISPDELISNYSHCKIIIAIRNEQGRSEVLNLLKNSNINNDNITILEADLFSDIPKFNIDEFKDNYIYAYYLLDGSEQYFDEIIKLGDNEVFADIGAFDGQTSLNFIKNVNNMYKKIYVFEPDHKSFENTKMNLLDNNAEKIELFPIGIGNKKEVLAFYANGSIGSKFEQYEVNSKHPNITDVNIDTIDNIFKDVKVEDIPTFIKMDIEGFELNALMGAKNIIKTHKPKLAISIYHKPEDLIELTAYIKSLVPEYKCYLRHYSCNHAETVLYAVL